MATRFRFRLESLRRLREALEKEAQRHLARTIRAQMVVEEQLKTLREQHRQTTEERRLQTGQYVDLERWRAIERFLLVLEKRIEATLEDLRRAEIRVAEARKALTKAHQDHLMLVRLNERRRELHLQEQFRDEAREMDELAVLRYRFNTARPKAIMA
jgi:flagellar export protein FliJ